MDELDKESSVGNDIYNGDNSKDQLRSLVDSTFIDPYEYNDVSYKASEIWLGITYKSYLSSDIDKDFYKINISTPGIIKVDLSNLPADYDLSLYNSNGGLPVAHSFNYEAEYETIRYNVTVPGEYYILVDSLGKFSTTQMYSLNVTRGVSVAYQGHVQDIGWQSYVKDGQLAGTEGQALRVEGFRIKLENAPAGLKIKYKTHVENIGWQDWVYDGAMAGTEGQGLRVEALQIMLEGTDADKYSVQYQAHVQNEGWQPWVSDGQVSGSFGKSQRIEALRIKIVKK